MSAPASFMSPAQLLAHWQGHRALTRRVLQTFPGDRLFTFSIGGMRPFGVLVKEMLGMHAPMVRGVATGEWGEYSESEASTREELLHAWDANTAEMDRIWPTIPEARFQEHMKAFGQYDGQGYDLILYCVDNEIHHRGQGYVYLRALGIAPPDFFER